MRLYYFFDPLCGWCYGFTDIVEQLTKTYPDLELSMVCGGMVIGKSEGYLHEKGIYISRILPRLTALTGSDFGDAYIKKLDDGDFYYSSYKPSVALIIIKNEFPEKMLDAVKFLQKSMFYFGDDLQNDEIYSDLSSALGMDNNYLFEEMKELKWKEKLKQDFEFTATVGIQGFPTLVADIQDKLYLVTHGWSRYSEVEKVMEELMDTQNV
jgi:putative protein-disulfide isomerase